MKALFLSSAVLVFGATASFAESFDLTDRQMDGVTAGLVVINDVVDISDLNVAVAIPVNAAVAANLCLVSVCTQNAEATATQRTGRINQRNR